MTIKRWTEQEFDTANKKYIFDGRGPGQHPTSQEKKPLPSSFTADGYFINAPLGKGLNPWERRYRSNVNSQLKIASIDQI